MELNQYSFEQYIMNCCRAREWNLRGFLKNKLISHGFRILEDDYQTHRIKRNANYGKVHNLLAIRGNPKICLVAHTDVVRDHGNKCPDVDPVIKEYGTDLIIQDRNCKVQIGGDDRLGVAINSWIGLNTGYDLGLLFTTDEEIGNISADYVSFEELNDFELLVQVDRGNQFSRQLVTRIGGTELCSSEVAGRLLRIAEKIEMPRDPVGGLMTDVLSIKGKNKCKNAVNMTCGYHNSHGPREYISIPEARATTKYVAEIIKDYELSSL